MISRVQAEFKDEVIERIEKKVAAWRGDDGEYLDEAGFCRSVSLKEIAEQGHVLTPGRYVGAEDVEDDDEAFAVKMQQLTEKLSEQIVKSSQIDALLSQQLRELGYEL
jgi:type I restriction enzyme M protein